MLRSAAIPFKIIAPMVFAEKGPTKSTRVFERLTLPAFLEKVKDKATTAVTLSAVALSFECELHPPSVTLFQPRPYVKGQTLIYRSWTKSAVLQRSQRLDRVCPIISHSSMRRTMPVAFISLSPPALGNPANSGQLMSSFASDCLPCISRRA